MTNLACSLLGTQGPFFLTLPLHSRQKIFKEKALPDIENYMFENHDQLRQAATECMCNMVLNKEVRLELQRNGVSRVLSSGLGWGWGFRGMRRPRYEY